MDTCSALEKKGADITYLGVNSKGVIDIEELKPTFKPATILVAIMYANNEIGTLLPVKEISKICREKGVLFFSDATQAIGKIPIDVNKDGIDLMAFSSHKMYGPKGVGALYVRRKNPRVKITPQIDGGGHERGLRSGTLNVPGIVGFGKACEIAMEEMEEDSKRLRELRDKLENALLKLDETQVNGDKENRLSHVSNISFQHAESENVLMSINKNIAVSTGSACMSATPEPSYVLKALGLSDEQAKSSLRFSLGRFTKEEEIDYAIEQVKNAINKLRKLSPHTES
jgi:cysteine desulfurase